MLFLPPVRHSLVVGGDLMLNGVRVGSGPLTGVASVLRAADFAFANLEVPLTDARVPTAAKSAAELRAKVQFVLKADPRHLATLKNAGLDAVSLANNHAMDYGEVGLAQERRLLARARIAAAGAGDDADVAASMVVVTAPDGFRVGLLGALAFVGRAALRKCSPAGRAKPGVNVLAFDGRIDDAARAKLARWIGSSRKRCDYLVVALHWGIERQTVPTSYQRALGHAVVEAGADLVWGSHPHVLQPVERYRSVPILYSTGNLVSALDGRTALFRLEIGTHSTGRIETVKVNIRQGRASIPLGEPRSVPPKRILTQEARRSSQ